MILLALTLQQAEFLKTLLAEERQLSIDVAGALEKKGKIAPANEYREKAASISAIELALEGASLAV